MENINIAILGFGVEGRDVLKYLQKRDIGNITIFDRKEKKDLDLNGINISKVKFVNGSNYLEEGLKDYQIIFRSPGVYRYLPEIVKVEKEGSEITSNIKYFLHNFKGLTIGVTGTKGKGTTSTLIYEILRSTNNDRSVYLTGNIGSPPLSILDRVREKDVVIMELSSFQLIDLDISPKISVVLNITNDHMDWHKDREEYVNAKKNIVKYQTKRDFKAINFDYETSKSFTNLSPSQNYFFSKEKKVKGAYVDDGVIYSDIGDETVDVGKTNSLLLRGKHNWENVCAAICASQLAGADIETIKKVVFSFKGLEHRLELVEEVEGVKYYNDSFSTNPQTTIAAVDSFTEPITLILGGYDKGLDFKEMVKHLCGKENLLNIVLIGDVEVKLLKLLKKLKFKNSIITMGKTNMKKIVEKCKEITKSGEIVLFSPACASFDMFSDYKDRGNQFKKAVGKFQGY